MEDDDGAGDALRAHGLGFRVGGAHILSDVDLVVRRGELLGIIGPNGAGKTSLFNVLTGLVPASAGTVELLGHDVTRLPPARRARLGLGRTFQTSSLFPALSVLENACVASQARLGGNWRFWHRPARGDEAAAHAASALEAVGLLPLAGTAARNLSHGDKRKLELAVLLAGGADVLLLDEPMAGVNAEDVPSLASLIGSLHAGGHTVLMVEHHLAAVLGLADRVAVLHHGRLIATGTPDEVMGDVVVQGAYVGEPL